MKFPWFTREGWTAVGVIVAILAVVVSLVMNLRSEKLTRKGQESQVAQAEATAARSEAAASLTEEYTRRVVDALEAIAATGIGGASRIRGALWELSHHDGDRYILKNVGDEPAELVRVSSDPTLQLIDLPNQASVLPGAVVTFMAAASLATRDRTITVQWVETGDPAVKQWKYPLPPRPPRKS